MTRKTESLDYPDNPLASLRALQELDATPASTPPVKAAGAATRRAPSHTADAGDGEPGPAAPRVRSATPAKPSRPAPASNPIEDAVREMLCRPYTADPVATPVTVSTVKIPTEVWERLGWVAKLTAKTKQEVITEALKAYFPTALKRG